MLYMRNHAPAYALLLMRYCYMAVRLLLPPAMHGAACTCCCPYSRHVATAIRAVVAAIRHVTVLARAITLYKRAPRPRLLSFADKGYLLAALSRQQQALLLPRCRACATLLQRARRRYAQAAYARHSGGALRAASIAYEYKTRQSICRHTSPLLPRRCYRRRPPHISVAGA